MSVGTRSCHPSGKEKTGYATRKHLGILDRIIRVHSNSDDIVPDFFTGSGTMGEAAGLNDRNAILWTAIRMPSTS